MPDHNKTQNPPSSKVLWGPYSALIGVFFLIILKSYAYYQSGSTVILGTLVDSLVDIAVSLMLFFAIKLSLKPADNDHRDGHGKAESIASLFQGALMIGAGIFLTFEATLKFSNPTIVENHKIAIFVALIAIFVSFIIITIQKITLKHTPSLALETDYHHYRADILLNSSVLLALLISLYGGPFWVDPIFALLIAGFFIFTALGIIGKSVDMLMDKELPDEIRNNIIHIVKNSNTVHDMHDLRTRMSGMKTHISFDVELAPDLSLKEAHDIVRNLEHMILKAYPKSEILIHMDPIGDIDDSRHASNIIHD